MLYNIFYSQTIRLTIKLKGDFKMINELRVSTKGQKDLVKKFVVNVFSDYSISLEEVKIPLDLPGAIRAGSARIAQTISVLITMEKEIKEAKASGTTINYGRIYNKALNKVATEMGITPSSIRDKLERKISLSASQLIDLLESYFSNNDTTIRDILLKSVEGTAKEFEDSEAITIYFSKKWF